MTDEAQTTGLIYECEGCGAGAGIDCLPDCPYMVDPPDFADLYFPPEPETLEDSEARLMAAVHRLPFGGNVGIRGLGAPDRQDYPHDVWMAKLADWMTEYQEVSTAMIEQLQTDVRKGLGAQIERAVLRRTLGVEA